MRRGVAGRFSERRKEKKRGKSDPRVG